MAHEYTMNVREEKKKEEIHSYTYIQIYMYNKGGILLKATFAFNSVQFLLPFTVHEYRWLISPVYLFFTFTPAYRLQMHYGGAQIQTTKLKVKL